MADHGTVILSFQDYLGLCILDTSHFSTYVSRSFEASEHFTKYVTISFRKKNSSWGIDLCCIMRPWKGLHIDSTALERQITHSRHQGICRWSDMSTCFRCLDDHICGRQSIAPIMLMNPRRKYNLLSASRKYSCSRSSLSIIGSQAAERYLDAATRPLTSCTALC